jgi:hypothetical protein
MARQKWKQTKNGTAKIYIKIIKCLKNQTHKQKDKQIKIWFEIIILKNNKIKSY